MSPPAVSLAQLMSKHPIGPDRTTTNQEHIIAITSWTASGKNPTELVMKPSVGVMTTLHVTNLPRGVTAHVLYDEFHKYGDIIGIHMGAAGEAMVNYHTTAAAKAMMAENNGQTVADSTISVHFVDVFLPPSEPEQLDDDSMTDSTISMMDDEPRQPETTGTSACMHHDDMGYTRTHAGTQNRHDQPQAVPRNEMQRAMDMVQALCPMDRNYDFDTLVNTGTTIATLLLFATSGQPGVGAAP